MVLSEAFLRIADRADHAPGNIPAAAHEIEYIARQRIQQQAVDGEITPSDILLGRGKMDMGGPAAVVIAVLGPVGGHFITVFPVDHQHHAELGAHGTVCGKSFCTSSGRADVTMS